MPKFTAAIFFLFVLVGTGLSQTSSKDTTKPKVNFPAAKGWVNDFENDFEMGTIATLTQKIEAHKNKTTNQIAIATIAEYAPYASLEAYTQDLFNTWGVGVKGKDNGVMVVFSAAKREVRITTGKGVDKKLSDAICKKIIDEKMLPKFSEGNYDQGLIDGITEIIRLLELP